MKQSQETKKNYSTLSNMLYVMHFTVKEQKVFIPLLLCYAICAACGEFLPALINSFIIGRLEQGLSVSQLFFSLLAITIVFLAVYEGSIYTNSQLNWRYFFARTKFIKNILSTLMYMDYEMLEQPEVLDAQQKALRTTSGSDSGIQGLLESTVKNLVNILKLIVALSLVVTKNIWIVVSVVLLTFLHFIVVDHTKKNDKKLTWDVLSTKWRRIAYLNNITSNFAYGKEIRLFQIKDWLQHKQKTENDIAHGLMCKSQRRWFCANCINQGIAIVQNLILYTWLIISVLQGQMSIALFILYLQVIPSFSSALSQLLDDVADTRRKSAEVTDYRTFLSFYQQEPISQMEKVKLSDLDLTTLEFSFEHVSFRYAGQEEYALKDLSLSVKPGIRLAIVGLNGAGKSTFTKLLMRLYEPTQGRILLNGIDIRSFDKCEYFRLFAPVFQNIELYAFSILENVTLHNKQGVDTERVRECLIAAGLKEKLNTLPKGMDTQLLKVLYDDGIDLSGGEKQKLALARALYKDSPVVVLDEPTAALDAYAESKLYEDFNELIGHKIAIYISHRLASTKFCDQIAVFKGGKLIEFGSHEELMLKQCEYYNLFQVQAKYYQEEGVIVNGE